VRVFLGGLQIVSVITKKSVQDLCLSKNKEAYAVIKATNVMIAMDREDNRKRKSILPKMNLLFINVEIYR